MQCTECTNTQYQSTACDGVNNRVCSTCKTQPGCATPGSVCVSKTYGAISSNYMVCTSCKSGFSLNDASGLCSQVSRTYCCAPCPAKNSLLPC